MNTTKHYFDSNFFEIFFFLQIFDIARKNEIFDDANNIFEFDNLMFIEFRIEWKSFEIEVHCFKRFFKLLFFRLKKLNQRQIICEIFCVVRNKCDCRHNIMICFHSNHCDVCVSFVVFERINFIYANNIS